LVPAVLLPYLVVIDIFLKLHTSASNTQSTSAQAIAHFIKKSSLRSSDGIHTTPFCIFYPRWDVISGVVAFMFPVPSLIPIPIPIS
jgi:hypothetical protein